ncbi:tethering complex subunit PEP3 [Nakaseomyces bracarensis]|uniref:tethering complex subunit PEP3 n=1 Tax=Nakaseomyces bracarensis TaxID=273131 RepID=UPI0038711E9E
MEVEIEHVELGFIKELSNNICTLQVQSNIMCFGLRSGIIFLIDLDTPSNVIQYRIPLVVTDNVGNSEKLLRIWLNPQGTTILVKTNYAKYYLCDIHSIMENNGQAINRDTITVVKQLSKKNCDVRNVTWIADPLAHSDEGIKYLCGTIKGQLFLVESRKFGVDPKVTTLYQSKNPIDGIYWNHRNGDCIVASKNDIIYWKNKTGSAVDPTITLNKSNQPSEMEEFEHVHTDHTNKFATHNTAYAWITDSGVVFSDVEQQKKSGEKILAGSKVILNMELPNSKYPISDLALSNYHLLLLRGSGITVVNQIDNTIAFNESIWSSGDEQMLGITADYNNSPPTYWCYSNSNIYEVILKNESQSVWRLLCDLKRFDEVLALPDLNKYDRDLVNLYKAVDLLDKGRKLEASKSFGETSAASICKVALKLMRPTAGEKEGNIDDIEALQCYLKSKLQQVGEKNSIQYILLSDWIVWNYLKLMNKCDESIIMENRGDNIESLSKNKNSFSLQLRNFIDENVNNIDRDTVYQLLERYDRKSELLYLAEKVGDYNYLLIYWIKAENWYESLKVLQKIDDPEIFYKYSNVLLVHSPNSTTHMWMKATFLNPVNLIPAILTYFTQFKRDVQSSRKTSENYALSYLQWYIKETDSEEKIIYNTVLYMMITTPQIEEDSERIDEYNKEILQFMEHHERNCNIDFILRLSLKFNRVEVAVYILKLLESYEDAVNLALDNDMIPMAKEIANTEALNDNITEKKKLWLKIARKLFINEPENPDIKQTIRAVITESENCVEIKDLLPLFNAFTTVANLKDELIRSLEAHNQSIVNIHKDIQNSLQLKKDIIQDTERFKERYQVLEAGSSCDQCHRMLQTRKFLVFPCGHNFHTDCLIKAILSSNDYNLKSKIENFQRRLNKDRKSVNPRELEKLMATKCCLCSDIAINKIDEPVTIMDTEREQWSIF